MMLLIINENVTHDIAISQQQSCDGNFFYVTQDAKALKNY